jgi:AmiR/NasT family two-component response regulator
VAHHSANCLVDFIDVADLSGNGGFVADDFDTEVRQLRDDVRRLLAAAIEGDDPRPVSEETHAGIGRVEDAHADEVAALVAHGSELDAEIVRIEDLRVAEGDNLHRALESRDVIGQAKGVIMVTTRCTADGAFDLLRRQSQFENRKIIEIANEIANRASGKRCRPPDSPS